MPHKPANKLPPIDLGVETIGQRIARLRKEKGYTQHELAEKIGTARGVISDYERGRIRLYDEMVARFALALETNTDDIIGFKQEKPKETVSLRYIKRIKRLDKLPEHKVKTILNMLDTMIQANEEKS